MDTFSSPSFRSVAAWQMLQPGDAASQTALTLAVERLNDASLSGLEDELELFVQTGFVGILMSSLLPDLHVEAAPLAA